MMIINYNKMRRFINSFAVSKVYKKATPTTTIKGNLPVYITSKP
jgi:hypothetical protein